MALRLPRDIAPIYLVVENDLAPQAQAVVEEVRARFEAAELYYLLEERIGIPMARNRAVNFTVDIGADLLAFIDDDEIAEEAWLAELVTAYRSSDAVLLGGPVLAAALPDAAGPTVRFLHSAIARRYQGKAKRGSALAANGRDGNVTITTGNWLASTELFTRHGLRFDEEMRFSGGSDATFFAEVRRRSLAVKWVPAAIVRETVPPERLNPRYQFRRALNQSNTSFRRKLDRSKYHALSLVLTVPLRAVGVTFLFLAIVPTAGATLLPTLRGTGWIAGRLAAVFGRRSDLYVHTTGH